MFSFVAFLLIGDDNAGIFCQIGTAKLSTDSEYNLLKKGMEYGTTDGYSPDFVAGRPCLYLPPTDNTVQRIGLAPSPDALAGVSLDNPLLGVLRVYDDSGGSGQDEDVLDTIGYDGYIDNNFNTWMLLGGYDRYGYGIFNGDVEKTAEFYKSNTYAWRNWSFLIPDPELSHDVGAGIPDAKLFIHNCGGGPEAFSFISFVKFSDATFNTIADSFPSGNWHILLDKLAGASVTHTEDYLEVTYNFDESGNEYFVVGPGTGSGADHAEPIYIGGVDDNIPAFEKNLVTILLQVEFIDSGGDGALHAKSPLKLLIRDSEGEVFVVSQYRVTVSGHKEWAWFSLSGKTGQFHIYRDDSLSVYIGNGEVNFPIYFWGIKVDDDPDSVNDESNAKFRIYKILVRTDVTPPDISFVHLVLPHDNDSFYVYKPVTFEWTPTEDLYSGMDGIDDAYSLQISADPSFSSLVAEYHLSQVYGVDLSQTHEFTSEGEYYWRIKVRDRVGNVAYSSVRSFRVMGDHQPPTVPSLISPSNGYTVREWRSVNLTFRWESSFDAISGLDHYTLRVWNTTGLACEVNTTDTSFTWTLPDIEGVVDYKWNVTAYDRAGNSISSETWSFVVDIQHDIWPPEEPCLLQPDNQEPLYFPGGFGSVIFKWANVSDVGRSGINETVINIYSSEGLLLNSTAVPFDSSKSEFSFVWYYNTMSNETIYWNVTVRDNTGRINFSETRSVKIIPGPPDSTPPESPQILSPSDRYQILVGDSVKFSWKATWDSGSGLHPVRAYRLEISNSTKFENLVFDRYYPPAKELLVETVKFDKVGRYYWKVVAQDFAGNTADSEVRTFEVVPHLTHVSMAFSMPNPVSLTSRKVVFSAKEGEVVSVTIYNLWGRRVVSIKGSTWSLEDEESSLVAPGVYFYTVEVRKKDGSIVKMGPFKLLVKE